MSANLFKEKQREHTTLQEACTGCGKVKAQPVGSSTNELDLGIEICDCQPEKSLVSYFTLVASEASKQKVRNASGQQKEINTSIGDQYEIIEVIGQGGMGTVYRAYDKVLGKEFAIKVLHDDLAADESAIKRFEQEASNVSDLTHANMLAVYGHGRTIAGAPYIVMDLLEGESLAEVLRRETRLDPFRLVNISIQICDALAHAHMKGLIHRDLKPSNVVLTNNDQSADMVKVLDFGIAKIMPSANRDTQNLTQTGDLFGSPSYMSPEQCLGCNLDARSDIYSLGCLMYELLTGNPPFAGKNPIQTVVKHLNEEPQSISKVASGLKTPAGLESIIMRCLEKDPSLRYQSMDHLCADLQLIAAGLVPKQKRKRVMKQLSLASLLVLTVALMGSAILLMYLANLAHFSSDNQIIVVSCAYVLALLLAALWTTSFGQFCWKQIKTRGTTDNAQHEIWSKATLAWLFMVGFSVTGIGVAQLPRLLNWPQLLDASSICCMTAAFSCVMAFTTSVGWLLSRLSQGMNPGFMSQNHLNRFYVVALCASLMLARPQLAWIPLYIGMYHNSDYEANVKTSKAQIPKSNLAYNLAIFMNPDLTEAYQHRGWLKVYAGNLAGAVSDFTKAINSSKEQYLEIQSISARARIYCALTDYKKAINDLTKLIKLREFMSTNSDGYGSWSTYLARARCFQKLSQYQDALADYNKFIGGRAVSNWHVGRAHYGRAEVYEQLRDYGRALADYSLAIVRNPCSAKIYLNRASLYKKLGEPLKAIGDYKTVLFDYKGLGDRLNVQQRKAVAIAEQELGMHEEAQADLAKVNKTDNTLLSPIRWINDDYDD